MERRASPPGPGARTLPFLSLETPNVEALETRETPETRPYSIFKTTYFLPAYNLYPAPSFSNFKGTGCLSVSSL